jgi:hypothetical protein
MQPTDAKLWARVKRQADQVYRRPSAYKSGWMVKRYKELGGKFKRAPTTLDARPLKRWFAEDWRNQHGRVGYEHSNDIYRPTKRVTRRTPKTHRELSARRIRRASREKSRTGRVRRF